MILSLKKEKKIEIVIRMSCKQSSIYFQCLANSDHPKLNISREGDTVNLFGQAVNKNLKNDACSTFFTSSLPEIRQGLLYIYGQNTFQMPTGGGKKAPQITP